MIPINYKDKKPGIYLIESKINGKKYVGSAANLYVRRHVHFSTLKYDKHYNKHLQRHFNKYSNDLEFSILEYCEKEDLIKREQYYIDTLNPEFNMCKVAGSCLGKKLSGETKRKISEMHKGKRLSKEHREKISIANKGKTVSEEARRKIGDGNRGEKNHMYGKLGYWYNKNRDDECKNKISRTLIKYYKSDPRLIILNRLQKHRKEIEIEGIKYSSIRDASRILDKPRTTINNRLKSKKFPMYKYI